MDTAVQRRRGTRPGSPRQLLAAAVQEAAGVGRFQAIDDFEHGGNAVVGGDGGAVAAHIGLDPAGADRDTDEALLPELAGHGASQLIQRRLRSAIGDPASAFVFGNGGEAAREIDDGTALSGAQAGQQGLGDGNRADGVDAESLFELFYRNVSESRARVADAGIVDQDVERLVRDTARQTRDALFVRDVELLQARKLREAAGLLRMPGRGEDLVSSLREMPREGQADPAVGAGDEVPERVILLRHDVRCGDCNFWAVVFAVAMIETSVSSIPSRKFADKAQPVIPSLLLCHPERSEGSALLVQARPSS